MRRNLLLVVSGLILFWGCLAVFATSPLDWIMADSWETGDISAWSSSNGYPVVTPLAASDGEFGLRTDVHFEQAFWVQDDTLANESVIRTDFDLNVDGLVMTDGDAFDVYIGWVVEDSVAAFALSLERSFGITGLRIMAWDNALTPITTTPVVLPTTGWHRIAIEFGTATGPGNTGELRLFVNGHLEAEITDFDNSGLVVKAARLGVARGVDQGSSGFLDFDVYTSVRLFDPWPCVRGSLANPTNGRPTCLDGEGRSTAIAVGGCGDGVAAWRGSEDLEFEYTPRSRLGGIYGKKVSGATGRQTDPPFNITEDERAATPDIAMDDNCNVVAVWASDLEVPAILARVVDIDGNPQTFSIWVASGGDAEELPQVGASSDGRFLIAWRREFIRTQSLWARHYQSDGTPNAAEFRVDLGVGAVSPPAVAMAPDGRSVVAFASEGAIAALLIDEMGQPGNHVSLSDGPGDVEPAVAMADNGSFIAVWSRVSDVREIFMRWFASDGAPLTGEMRIDTIDPADCSEPSVHVGENGRTIVVWSSIVDGVPSIRGRELQANKAPARAEFIIEGAGRVWRPARPKVAAAERLLFSYSEQTDPYGFARGSLIGAMAGPDIFADGFESGDTIAWSETTR